MMGSDWKYSVVAEQVYEHWRLPRPYVFPPSMSLMSRYDCRSMFVSFVGVFTCVVCFNCVYYVEKNITRVRCIGSWGQQVRHTDLPPAHWPSSGLRNLLVKPEESGISCVGVCPNGCFYSKDGESPN